MLANRGHLEFVGRWIRSYLTCSVFLSMVNLLISCQVSPWFPKVVYLALCFTYILYVHDDMLETITVTVAHSFSYADDTKLLMVIQNSFHKSFQDDES